MILIMIEGTQSETAPVTSGVPQGSVLGPLLFLCYINDLPTCVSSDIRLFADDCLLYRTIHSQQDAVILQEDLNMLQQWEAQWLMSFNPGKCEELRVTNKRKHIIHTHYKIHGMILDTVDKTKYLGVTIQSKLNWKPLLLNQFSGKPSFSAVPTVITILVLPPGVVCESNCALPMPGTADGDVVSRCQVLGRAGSVHHGADQ